MHLFIIICALLGVIGLSTVAIAGLKHCKPPHRKPRIYKEAAALVFFLFMSSCLGGQVAAAEPAGLSLKPEHFLAGEWNLDLYGAGTLANESRSRKDLVFGGGAGLNYWITRGFGLGLKGETDNLVGGFEHSVFDRALGRVLVRAPLWDRIAPYGYAEGGYAFERNRWVAGTGGGLDLRLAKGWALFGEAGLQVTPEGRGSMKGEAGVRLCW